MTETTLATSAKLVDRLLTSRVKLAPPKLGSTLYLYGQGKLGHAAQEFFESVGYEIAGVFDWNTTILPCRQAQVAVCIVEYPFTPIIKSLHDKGFENVVPFYDLAQNFCWRHPLADSGWFADPFTPFEQEKVAGVLERWE